MLKQVQKVYGFGAAFYADMTESQRKRDGWFTFFLYLFAIMALGVSYVITRFMPEDSRFTPLQVHVYFTCGIAILYILLQYANRLFIVDRNNKIDITNADTDWHECEAKVVDFWLAQELKLWGYQKVLYIIVQIVYKNRNVRLKLRYNADHIYPGFMHTAVDDMGVKNLKYLYNRLLRGNKKWQPPQDIEQKHALHKITKDILQLGMKADVYMHEKNLYLPYGYIDVSEMMPHISSAQLLWDYIMKGVWIVINLFGIWLVFSWAFAALFGLLTLLGL